MSAGKRLLAAAKEMRETVRQEMDSVEIPEDIREKAQAVLDEINSDELYVIPIAPIIARAILAEREKNAAIAEAFTTKRETMLAIEYAVNDKYGGDATVAEFVPVIANMLASAIRKGDAG
jgi:hypothetical protein